jgi:mannose-6-phosphate isomerase-like protein (cupin superfamily)
MSFIHDEVFERGDDAHPFRLNMFMSPKTPLPVMHTHVKQIETYRVIDGVFELKVGRERLSLRPGDTFTVPPNTPHTIGNFQSTPTTVYTTLTPGLRTAEFFERLATFQDDPGLLQMIKFSTLVRQYPVEQHYPLPVTMTFVVLDAVGRLLRIEQV